MRTASKAFGVGSGGDEKSGCQGQFKLYAAEFLRENSMKTVPLRSYRGTRFNILFYNSACVFFLHKKIRDFLETTDNRNRLLLSILHDLKTPEFIAGIKALGLLCKLVTSPLWSVLEDITVSILDLNDKYLQLATSLENASKNVQSFMAGVMLVFGEDSHIDRDAIFNALVTPDEYDSTAEVFLEVLLATLCESCKKLFKDIYQEVY